MRSRRRWFDYVWTSEQRATVQKMTWLTMTARFWGNFSGSESLAPAASAATRKTSKLTLISFSWWWKRTSFPFLYLFFFSFGNRAAATSLTDTFAYHPLQQIIVASYKMTTLASATVILSSSIFQIFKTPHYVFIYNASADATHFAKHKKTLNISKKIRNSTSAKKAKL